MERDNMTGPNRPDRWRIDMTEQEQLRQLKEEYENMIIPETGRERLQAGIDRARMEKKRAEHARRRFCMDGGGCGSCRDDRTAKYQYADSPCHGKYSVAGWLF